MLYVPGSMSAKTTLAPAWVTASAVAMKLLAGTMTSSPFPIPRHFERDKEGIRAVPDADAVPDPAETGEGFFEVLDVGAANEGGFRQTSRDDGIDLRFDRFILFLQVYELDSHKVLVYYSLISIFTRDFGQSFRSSRAGFPA